MYLKSFTVGANNAHIHQSPKTFIGLLDSCNQPLINNIEIWERPFSCNDDENPPVVKGRVGNFDNRYAVIKTFIRGKRVLLIKEDNKVI